MLCAGLIAYVVATTSRSGVFAALLAGPAVLALRRLLARRQVAPLIRGSVEENAVMAAAALGAASAVLLSLAAEKAGYLSGIIAPLSLGLTPWFAGELLSGPSRHQLRSLSAAIAVSCMVGWFTWVGITGLGQLFPDLAVIQLASALLAALLSAKAYLATRGQPREVERAAHSNSIREKRSLLGSSGFFGCCAPGWAVCACGGWGCAGAAGRCGCAPPRTGAGWSGWYSERL